MLRVGLLAAFLAFMLYVFVYLIPQIPVSQDYPQSGDPNYGVVIQDRGRWQPKVVCVGPKRLLIGIGTGNEQTVSWPKCLRDGRKRH